MNDPAADANARRQRHARLSAGFARLDDRALRAVIGSRPGIRGWGVHETVEYDGTPVFVKRVPLTKLESDHPSSTKNLFGMPTYYNYGVGSAGFGVWRELATHIATTDWVLTGGADGFPLLYHHRVLPMQGPRPADWGEDRRDAYVRYWGGSESISRFILERDAARNELVIVLEHVPHTLAAWLTDNPGSVEDVADQLFRTITFLRANGVVHFDAHFGNVVTDGTRHYLTDYGLVLAERFDLGAGERAFLRRHRDYDYAEVLLSVGSQLSLQVARLGADEGQRVRHAFGIERETAELWRYADRFIERAEELAEVMPVNATLLAFIKRYRPVMRFMGNFFGELRANPRKDTRFDDRQLRRLVEEAGVQL